MKFILASQNSHKAQEFAQALTSIQISPSPITLDVDENGSTFIENARIKARAFATALAQNAIADDSGLSVDALQGAPGIYSARYATLPPDIDPDPDRTAANNRKLIRALAQTPPAQRTAHFTCALCLVIVAPTDIQTTLESPTLRAAAQFYNATGTPCPASAPIADIARAEIAFEAHAYGTILDAPRGTAGFGYDPLFLSDDTHTTFAELTCDQKLSVSHRGKAIERLRSLFAP
ncbi:MAG: hypothetical protein KIG72_01470 [Bradymonadales bacterium]|nr:hypothetical protein [Bradymonadales bacterium]